MGEIYEITTWPNQRIDSFYKISSSGLIFEVKSSSSAVIGLAEKQGKVCDAFVVIGRDQKTWITGKDGVIKVRQTPNILSGDEFRQFWLSLRNGFIQLGHFNERTPIVSYFSNLDLRYVAFDGWGLPSEVYWRFELPPVLEKPNLRTKISSGDLHWVKYKVDDNAHMPDDALIGGYDDEKECNYIIRKHDDDRIHLGWFTPFKDKPSLCTNEYQYRSDLLELNEFEVLCGFNCRWVRCVNGRVPVDAVVGGVSTDNENIYIGRSLKKTQPKLEDVQFQRRDDSVPFTAKAGSYAKTFDILVYNSDVKDHRQFIRFNPVDTNKPDSEDEDDSPNDDFYGNMFES